MWPDGKEGACVPTGSLKGTMKYGREEETAAQEKTSCQTESWTKVSEETDGFGKAAKG